MIPETRSKSAFLLPFICPLPPVQVDVLVFGHLLQGRFPTLWRHLQELEVDAASVTMHWFLLGFLNSLPLDSVLRGGWAGRKEEGDSGSNTSGGTASSSAATLCVPARLPAGGSQPGCLVHADPLVMQLVEHSMRGVVGQQAQHRQALCSGSAATVSPACSPASACWCSVGPAVFRGLACGAVSRGAVPGGNIRAGGFMVAVRPLLWLALPVVFARACSAHCCCFPQSGSVPGLRLGFLLTLTSM